MPAELATLEMVQPGWSHVPPYDYTLGPEVALLNELAHYHPDPEQQLILDGMFAYNRHPEGDRLAAMECGVCAARQNLKTGVLKMAVIGWLFLTEEETITWSAHEMNTTREAFRDLKRMILAVPAFRARLKRSATNGFYNNPGDQRIELENGQRVLFRARTRSGGRGLTGDKIILDEAMYIDADMMGSLLPTLSAVPDPQIVYAGSAGFADSAHWRDVRDRGREGNDDTLCWHEWGNLPGGCARGEECTHTWNPPMPGCALDNDELIRKANPQAGGRITWGYLRKERRTLNSAPMEYARERLGWWEEPLTEAAKSDVDLKFWARLAEPSAPAPTGGVAVAVDVPPDLSATSISVAWRVDGVIYAMVKVLRGTKHAVAWLKAMQSELDLLTKVRLHGGGPAGALIKELEAAYVDLDVVSSLGAAQATGAFSALITPENGGGFAHLGQKELNTAVAAAKLRTMGDAKMWDRRDLTDISTLWAVTLAAAACVEVEDYDPLDSIG